MIRVFAAHPTAANLVMIGLLFLGILAIPELRRETFPRIEPRRVEISIAYPGAAPAQVSESLCARIEDALDGIENLDEVLCVAREGAAVATAEMTQGENLQLFSDDVEAAVDAITDFPDEAEDPIYRQVGRTDFVASVAITGTEDPVALKALAEQVKDRMRSWRGPPGAPMDPIPQVAVNGFSDPQIRIEVSGAAARSLGLSLDDIADALRAQNVELPAGELEGAAGSAILRFSDERADVDGVRDIVVASSAAGGEIRIGDIASVTRQFEDPAEKSLLDGRRAALLDVTKTASEDSIAVADSLRAFLESERQRAPPGVAFTIVSDSSEIVQERLTMIVVNAVQGLALVFAVVWLFFGFRQAFWISAGLPVSFLGALAVMVWLDYSINMLTLVALLIVIGILMDDALVIAENIETHRARGASPLDAAVHGAAEVSGGVIASFLTTTVVFGSMAFLKGDIGEVLRVIPVVMLIVLVVSLVEAFLILPNHLAHVRSGENPIRARVDGLLERFKDRVVGPFTALAIRWRYLTLGLAAMIFCGALAAFAGGALKFEAFPSIDGDSLEARLELAQGAPIADTEAVVDEIVASLRAAEAALAAEWDAEAGGGLVRTVLVNFNENADAGATGAHLATVKVDLSPGELGRPANARVLDAWRREAETRVDRTIRDIVRLNITEGVLGPAGRDIEIRLIAPTLEIAEAAAADMLRDMAGYRGVYNLADDLSPGAPELRFSLKEGASALGVDSNRIAQQLRTAFYGETVDEVRNGGDTVEIDLRLVPEDRDDLGDIDAFAIRTASGALAPLSAVANVETGVGYASIRRIDGRTAVTVTGDVDPELGNASEIVADALARLGPELAARYPGVSLAVEGQSANAAETQGSMMSALALSLVGIYLLLSLQLRSYTEPLVVMVVIPFALIGVVAGHMLLGINVSLPSILGLVSLAGIVVNDSILLVNQIKERHDPADDTVAAAAPAASQARFRAILLTSITTIAGVMPLLFETSLQAQILVPLVTSIGFGLIATTLLILFVVPPFYAVLDDFGLTSLAAERRAHRAQAPDPDPAPDGPPTAAEPAA